MVFKGVFFCLSLEYNLILSNKKRTGFEFVSHFLWNSAILGLSWIGDISPAKNNHNHKSVYCLLCFCHSKRAFQPRLNSCAKVVKVWLALGDWNIIFNVVIMVFLSKFLCMKRITCQSFSHTKWVFYIFVNYVREKCPSSWLRAIQFYIILICCKGICCRREFFFIECNCSGVIVVLLTLSCICINA